VRAMPADAAAHHDRRCDRRVRRVAARDRPRAQVRWPADARASPVSKASRSRRSRSPRGRRRRACSAAPLTRAPARVQSGARACAPSRIAPCRRPEARAEDASASGSPSGAPQRKRARRIRVSIRLVRTGAQGCARRRCEYDGCDVECVRVGPASGGRARSAGAYRSPSRDATALMTSAATASFARVPSSSSHSPCAAWRR
jgi:hypothetical protein